MASPVVQLTEDATVKEITHVLTSTTHCGFPIVTSQEYPHVCGFILRRQLLVLLEEKVWRGTAVCFAADSDMRARYVGSFASVSDSTRLMLTPEELKETIDMRPYIDPCPYQAGVLMPLNRVHRMFNELGVRHLPVVGRHSLLAGHLVDYYYVLLLLSRSRRGTPSLQVIS